MNDVFSAISALYLYGSVVSLDNTYIYIFRCPKPVSGYKLSPKVVV